MKTRLPINITEIEKYYRIEEDGAVFSLVKDRYLRAVPNSAGYLHVCLHLYMKNKFFSVHRLVSAKYNGECPPNKEACHDDGNKQNNHYTNIIYRTHSENVLQSYSEHGRKAWMVGGHRSPHSFETKQLMAQKKNKPVLCICDGVEIIYPSIDIASKELLSYRKKIYRCIKEQIPFKDKNNPDKHIILSFAPRTSPD